MKRNFAEWSTKEINDLPDSSFAYIEDGGTKDKDGKTTPRGKRHLPYKDADGKVDLPHVRNALARLDATQIPASAKPGIKKKLEDILAKKKASDLHVGIFPFQFDQGSNDADIPTTIHLIPVGSWDHDLYGEIVITGADIQQFEDNFNANIRNGVPITAGHEGFDELPAQGWIKEVFSRADGLWGKVEWNDSGAQLLADKQFKFFSPEFYREYEDAQTHQTYRNVLVGGALTKAPYFKELQPVVFSDRGIKNSFNDTMDLTTLLAKNIEDLSDDEKAFIKTNEAQLTDEQKTSHAAVLGEPEAEVTESNEDKAAREAKEAGDANEAAGLNRDGSAKVEASDKKKFVQVSASEFAALKLAADKGAQAYAELEKKNLSEATAKLVFGEGNKEGRFLPKSKDSVSKFMETLSPAQRTAFSTLVAELPKMGSALFSEVGKNAMNEGTAAAQLEALVATEQKADAKMSYSDALKKVLAANPELETRYDQELVAVGA